MDLPAKQAGLAFPGLTRAKSDLNKFNRARNFAAGSGLLSAGTDRRATTYERLLFLQAGARLAR